MDDDKQLLEKDTMGYRCPACVAQHLTESQLAILIERKYKKKRINIYEASKTPPYTCHTHALCAGRCLSTRDLMTKGKCLPTRQTRSKTSGPILL